MKEQNNQTEKEYTVSVRVLEVVVKTITRRGKSKQDVVNKIANEYKDDFIEVIN